MAFQSVMFKIENGKDGSVDRSVNKMTAWKLRDMLTDGEYCVFVRILRFYFVECGYDHNIVRHEKVCLANSAYVFFVERWR